MKKVSKRPIKKLQNDLVKSQSDSALANLDDSKPQIESIRVKEMNLNGETKEVKRVYVRAKDTDSLAPVGWVANDNIRKCMICYERFGFFYRKHHCRACGNLVCYSCSGQETLVTGVEPLGPLRVCVDCCTKEVHNVAVKVFSFYSPYHFTPLLNHTTKFTPN